MLHTNPIRKGFLRTAPTGEANPDGGANGNTDPATDPAKGGDGAGDGSKPPVISGDVDPDRVARTIAAARAGETKAKADLKAEKDRVAAILKAAGLTPDGTADPAEALKAAAAERDKATASARDTAVELAVYKTASKATSGVNPDALLDSLKFRTLTADLDPSAADFQDKVDAAIKAALKDNPSLAAAKSGTPGKSGGDFPGGNGTGTPITEEQLAKMTPSEISKAYSEGKLKHLM